MRESARAGEYVAIEQRFDEAAQMCKAHFEQRKPYYLYAARIGAELMLRGGHLHEAEMFYEAVIAAKTLPWARLGVARAQVEGGFQQRGGAVVALTKTF